ncbi:MAG: hypothetical protein RR251_05025 [Hydrogenoanaerobacterium sp.]
MPSKTPQLITLQQYISSVREFEKNIKENKNMPEGRAVANRNGSVAFLKKISDVRYLNLDWVKSLASGNRLITDTDIKAQYIAQLDAMELPTELLADEQLQSSLQAARQEAMKMPTHMTLRELQLSVNQRLEASIKNGTLTNILYDKNLTELGLQNALAARIQNPKATKIFTAENLVTYAIKVKAGQKPIYIFTPVLRSFFERGGRLLPVQKATEQEQFKIINKKLPVRQDVKYYFTTAYDISQLELPAAELQKLYEVEQPDYTCEIFKKFAEVVKTPSLGGIKLKETPMQGMTLDSIYSKADKSIVINSELHESRKMSEYIKRISDAIVDLTSPSVPILQAFEAQLLSFQLHTACGLKPSMIDADKLTSTFVSAESNISSAATGSFASMERTLARVNRMSSFVQSGLSQVAVGLLQENPPQQSQQRAFSQSDGNVAVTEELKNFINQIQ